VVQRGQSILVVDGLSETTEVLKAVFEPRGHAVSRVRQTQFDARSTAQPGVVVWHANDADELRQRSKQWRFDSVPHIVIGKASLSDLSQPDSPPSRRFSQPFQYRELLQAVESALLTLDKVGQTLD
jgi:CheY-like chemotaxis protein